LITRRTGQTVTPATPDLVDQEEVVQVVILEFLVQVVEFLTVVVGDTLELLVLLVVKVVVGVMVVLGFRVSVGRTPVLVVHQGWAAMFPVLVKMVVLVVQREVQKLLVVVVMLVLQSNT